MTAMMVGFVGLLGLIVGSFLNVVVHRVPRRESIVSPASRCPGCGMPIAARDNIPVLSWLLLRGRCRHCREPISARYPLLELLTAAIFATVAAVRGVDADLTRVLPFAAALVALAAIDLEHRVLPNRIVVPLAVFGLAAGALLATPQLPELLIAGAAAFTALLLIALVQPRGMGMGDVKLAGAAGLFLGLSIVPALLLAFLAGSVVGLGLMAIEGASARKRAIPFGPFLALGSLLALLVGPELIDLYSQTLLD
jgi:leader peptidase (prepilin peptidase)/N-methyltransferase